jgi:hypothetical protein
MRHCGHSSELSVKAKSAKTGRWKMYNTQATLEVILGLLPDIIWQYPAF